MNNLAELRKLTGNQTAFFLVFIGALIAPGVLIIWRFAPHIIEKGDLGILLLLALSIDLPLIIINLLLCVSMVSEDSFGFDDTPKAMYRIAFASGLSIFAVLGPLAFNAIGPRYLGTSSQTFIWNLFLMEIALGLMMKLALIQDKRKECDGKSKSKVKNDQKSQ